MGGSWAPAPAPRRGGPSARRTPVAWLVAVVAVVALLALGALGALPHRTPDAPGPAPTSPVDRLDATVDLGDSHTCRVGPGGGVQCWGDNSSAQLGIGIRSRGSTTPVDVLGLDVPVVAVSAGGAHTCALAEAGDVWCWGENYAGQLGDGSRWPSGLPVAVRGLHDAVGLAAGASHTCAVTRAGGVRCWGADSEGQLGAGRVLPTEADPPFSPTPVDVVGLPEPVASVSAGAYHTCAVTVGGSVWCWGDNGVGQLGDGATLSLEASPPAPRVPVQAVGPAQVTDVAAGLTHTCALTASGEVSCWGANDQGQLGDGTPTLPLEEDGRRARGPSGRSTAGAVVGLPPGVRALSAANRTCAVTSEGAVLCWGPAEPGVRSEETATEDGAAASSSTPVEVVAPSAGAAAVSIGYSHGCVESDAAPLRCWGENNGGQLGDGTTLPRPSPVAVVAPRPGRTTPRPVTINVIIVDSDLDVTRGIEPEEQEAAAEQARRLAAGDPAVLRAIAEGFRSATAGALDPTVRVVTAAAPLSADDRRCVELGYNTIERTARPHRVAGALNVVVARALICDSEPGQSVGGYDLPEEMPVTGWVMLGKPYGLLHTMIHEYGHELGLVHAGSYSCDDPARRRGCTIDEVGDPASVMSYTHTSDAFTDAELHQLGFLTDASVGTASGTGSREYRVGTTSTALSAILLDDGRDLRDRGSSVDPDRVYVSGEPGRLEVRDYSTDDVPSVNHDWTEASLGARTFLEPEPGTRLYRRAGVEIVFVGPDDEGNAVLRVTR